MKALIAKIDQLIADEKTLNTKIGIDKESSYHYQMLVKLKELALAEQERMLKQLEEDDSHDYYSNVAMVDAIKIVKGER